MPYTRAQKKTTCIIAVVDILNILHKDGFLVSSVCKVVHYILAAVYARVTFQIKRN